MRRVPTPILAAVGSALVLAGCNGCSPRPPTPEAPAASVPTTPSATASAPIASAASAPSPKSDPCPPPGPGRISDDESPAIRGGKSRAMLLEWLAARGVSKASAVAWFIGRFGRGNLDAPLAEDTIDAECGVLTVGDKGEEALVCEHMLTYSWMQVRALVLVVRGKRPVAVLDVGLAVRALDFPDARHLDLALTLDADGRGADLEERAPDGTILVEPPSSCREREARLDACEAALAKGVPPDPVCPIVREKDGAARLDREMGSRQMLGGYPATLHDCAAARAELKTVEHDIRGNDPMRKEARATSAFVEKACKDRGRYVWKGDRFVRP